MRNRLAAIPLRATLVMALVALTAAGLLASGISVTTALERSLASRTDQELHRAMHSWAEPGHRSHREGPEAQRPSGRFFVRMWDSDGTLLMCEDGDPNTFGCDRNVTLPDVPDATSSVPTSFSAPRPITVGSINGDVRWRVQTEVDEHGKTVLAMRLTDNRDTVQKLVVFQCVIGAIVLALLGVAAFFVVRRSLRPLRGVEKTAMAIAGGDMSRRVPMRGTNTEVDRLAQALNVMLTQIQYGVAATEASEAAARRSESKMRQFIADASHELRTPLTTIRGFAELYRQGAVTDTVMLLNRIENESARMGLLVEDLLMLARLDAQRPLERRPVDLLELSGDAVHNARALAAKTGRPQRQVGLSVVDGQGTLEVPGDRARLQQVLANLLNNAITHTPAEASVTVRLTPAADRVRVDVVDTGPGLTTEDAERVFERFFRTDSSRTRTSGGTGLGLSIVHSLVQAHEGRVWVESGTGKGATFVVELPREGVSLSETPPPKPNDGSGSHTDAGTKLP